MHATWCDPSAFDERIDASFYAPEFTQLEDQLRNANAPCIRFGAHVKRVFKGAFYVLASEYAEAGVPFLRVSDITDGFVDLTKATYLPVDVHDREKRTSVESGNLLVAKGGSIGNSAVVPEHVAEANISQDVVGVELEQSLMPYFAQAFMSSTFGKRQMVRWAQGNVHPHITNEGIRSLYIIVPDESVQSAIGRKLQKAERHRNLAVSLQRRLRAAMSNALGAVGDLSTQTTQRKGWYVPRADVEPRLDAEYYLPEYIEMLRQLKATVATVPLAEIEIDGGYGTLPKSSEYGTGRLPLIRGMDLTGSELTDVPTTAPRVPDTYLRRRQARVEPNQIMLLIKGATIDAPQSVGVVSESWNADAIVNGSVYKFNVREPNDPYYICAYFGTPYGLMQKRRAIANTGINYNDQDAIRSFYVALPDVEIQNAIGDMLRESSRHLDSITDLVEQAISDINSLVNGTLDFEELAKVDSENVAWLESNPMPELNGSE